MNPKSLTYALSWLIATIAAILTHKFPWIPKMDPEVQEIVATLGAWAISNFLIAHKINPLGLVSRSKGKEAIKEIASKRS